MKKILNKRFELGSVIGILVVMLIEYVIGVIWDAGFWAVVISFGLFMIIILLTELVHKKRLNESVKKKMNEFISDAEEVLGDYKEPVLEQRGINNKINKVDKVIIDVFKLNYYTRKLRQLIYLGDDRALNILSKSERLWNSIQNEYAGKEKDLEYIILQSAKLTWLLELINRNKESDDYIFPLTYSCAGNEEEYTAEGLVEQQRKGQITVFFADGGYGKTWTVERMARVYAERYMASFWSRNKGNTESEFPVFVKVGDIKSESRKPICDKMKEQLCYAFALQSLKKENMSFEISDSDVVFVDALDEARNSNINTLIIEEMKQCQNTVIFTTRPTEIACLNELTRKGTENPRVEYKIVDVMKAQVRNYLEKELSRQENNSELTCEEIQNVLSQFDSSGFAEKCTSPFLLYCFVNTVREMKKNTNEVFDIGENLNELYGAFIAGIIEREIKGKSLRGLISVDEVLRYLNKFAIAILEKEEKCLSGAEASCVAREYFGNADFDGRNLENAENDINISLREMHIFTVEGGKYKFISDDFMNAVIEEDQIDEILMRTFQGTIYNSDYLNLAKLKLDKLLSNTEEKDVGNFLGELYARVGNPERVIVLLGDSMSSVNKNYIRENIDETFMHVLIKWIVHLEFECQQLHYAYGKSCIYISRFITSWIIEKTKDVKYDRESFGKIYEDFRSMISNIQRVGELKRHFLSTKNIDAIIASYGDNDYPKFLWFYERLANYNYSMQMYRTGNVDYSYPTKLENVCKSIMSKIDSSFEFYELMIELGAQIKLNDTQTS